MSNWVEAKDSKDPKDGFNHLVYQLYINKPLGQNKQFHTQSQLEDKINRYEAKKRFEDERNKLLQQRGVKKFKVLPEELKQLSVDSFMAGSISLYQYKVEYDDKNHPTLYKRGSKTKFGSEYVSIAPIEEAYDRLMEIHVQENHNNGTDLYKYVCDNRLFSYPRDLVKVLPRYCPHCRSIKISAEEKKKKIKVASTFDIKVNASEVATENLLENQSLRRSEFYTIKVQNGSEVDMTGYIVSFMCSRSTLVQSKIIENFDAESLYNAIIELLTFTAVPKEIGFEFSVNADIDVVFSEVRIWECAYFHYVNVVLTMFIKCSINIHILSCQFSNTVLKFFVQVKKKLTQFYSTVSVNILEPQAIKSSAKNEYFEEYFQMLRSIGRKNSDTSNTERLCMAAASYNKSKKWYKFNKEANIVTAEVIDLTLSQEDTKPSSKSIEEPSKLTPSKSMEGPSKPTAPRTMEQSSKPIASKSIERPSKPNASIESTTPSKASATSEDSKRASSTKKPDPTSKKGSTKLVIKRKRSHEGVNDHKVERSTKGQRSLFSPSAQYPFSKELKSAAKVVPSEKSVTKTASSKNKSDSESSSMSEDSTKKGLPSHKPDEISDDSSFESIVFDDYASDYDEIIGVYVGRSLRERSKDIPTNYDLSKCNVCRKLLDDDMAASDHLGEDVLLCRSCKVNKKIPVGKLSNLRERQRDKNSCVICNQRSNRGKFHMLGKLTICRKCISLGKCSCSTCYQQKGNIKSVTKCLYSFTNGPTELIEFEQKNKYQMWSQLRAFMKPGADLAFMYKVLASVTIGKHDSSLEIARCLDRAMTKEEFMRFGTVICSTNSKREKTYRWKPAQEHNREFTMEMMEYLGRLLQNTNTLFLGAFTCVNDLNIKLLSIPAEWHEEGGGFFAYRYMFAFLSTKSGSWRSTVVRIRKRVIDFYGLNKQYRDGLFYIFNEQLSEKVLELDSDERKMFKQEEDWSLRKSKEYLPNLDVYTDNNHRHDTGVIAAMFTWVHTMDEWWWNSDIRSECLAYVQKENIERIRALWMFFALSSDTNVLLCHNFVE